jgi:hypothetical protein
LAATWAGHSGEAQFHETRVDDLLATWAQLHHGGHPALTLAEQEPCG